MLPYTVLAFVGTLILGQYTAGIPMTSRLLVPLVVGALVAKGHAESITMEAKPGMGAANTNVLNITGRWVRKFCRNVLKMSYKRATRSKKHQPDAEELKATTKLFLLRLTYLVFIFSIPMELVANMDETGVLLMPLRSQGWAPSLWVESICPLLSTLVSV